MEGMAKSQPGKNSLAIQLHKGSGDRAEIVLPILNSGDDKTFALADFMTLIDEVNSENIAVPRGFVYKLAEEYEVMEAVLTEKTALLNYIDFILEKSRDSKKATSIPLEKLIHSSIKCAGETIDYQALIDRLYFLRFLTEDEA